MTAVVDIGKSVLGIETSGEKAAKRAAGVQAEASEAGIAEQRRQFDITQQSLQPFTQAGQAALNQQRILLGLGGTAQAPVDPNQARREELQGQISQIDSRQFGGGRIGRALGGFRDFKLGELQSELGALPAAPSAPISQLSPQEQQAQAFAQLSESPGQQFLRERGQRNLVRNAAAIGGLGGGNVREALVQQGVGFAQQDLQNRFGRLGQVAGQGQAAATNVGQFGAQAASNISQGLVGAGQARASGILGAQQAQTDAFGNLLSLGTGLASGGFLGETAKQFVGGFS